MIIGAGFAGVTTAYHILKQCTENEINIPNILILEARELCSGATGRNGGHTKVKVPTLAAVALAHGARKASEMQAYVHTIIAGLKEIVEDEDIDCEFELRRSWDVQLDTDESSRLKMIYDKSRKEGQAWTKDLSWIEGEEKVRQVTSITGAVSACSSSSCSFWPYKFVSQLLARMIERYPELNVQTTTPVTTLRYDEKRKENILSTERGEVKAGKVVFATNGYTAGLIEEFKGVIVPIRGMATHIVPEKKVHPHLSNTYNIDYGKGMGVDYLNPRPDGGIVVGGGGWRFKDDRASWYGNFNDAVGFKSEVEEYWNGYMQRNFLGWEGSGAKVDKVWVGIMGGTPDGFAHVGRVPNKINQWILAGFNGGGMALILTASKAVAKMTLNDIGFMDVQEEFGLMDVMATSLERLKKAEQEK